MKDTHPLVAFSFFVAVISLTMCAAHPLLAPVSLMVALLYLAILKGAREALRWLALSVLICLVVAVFNAIFVKSGFTVIFYFLRNPVMLEAIQYGFALGCMLAAVLIWFRCYQEVVGSDRFLAIFSGIVPVTAMMISMIFNYIPQVLQKAQQINDAHRAFAYVDKTSDQPSDELLAWSPPAQGSRKRSSLAEKLRWPVRLSSILMGWSMETGLATAASMRARAYGATRRSSYLPLFWTMRDWVLMTILVGLAIVAAIAEFRILSGFLFYPRMSPLAITWLYLPFIAFMGFPLVYEGGIRLKWRLSKF